MPGFSPLRFGVGISGRKELAERSPCRAFQSPSLRGWYIRQRDPEPCRVVNAFQSPSLRGWYIRPESDQLMSAADIVSVPFASGLVYQAVMPT